MISLGYKQATIERYDAVWRGLIAFCNENYGGKFTLEAGRFYVWSKYGLQLGDADTSHNVNRAIMLIDDFQTYGVVYGCSRNHKKQFSEKYNNLFTGFLEYLKADNVAEGSIKTWKSRLFRLEHFLLESGLDEFNQVELEHINNYVKSLV